jgi:hypothetical protein
VYNVPDFTLEKMIKFVFKAIKIYNINIFVVYMIGLNINGSSLNISNLLYTNGFNELFN